MKKQKMIRFFMAVGIAAILGASVPADAKEALITPVSVIEEPQVFLTGVRVTGKVAVPTQKEIRKMYKKLAYDKNKSDAATGYSLKAPYKKGSLNQTSLNNALNALNFVRYVAGIPYGITLDPEYNSKTQAAALVNAVNNKMTHFPEKPAGMDEELYNEGYDGASSSNLGSGYDNLASSIVDGYMWDSDSGNIQMMGHRRWVLNPTMTKTGFGKVEKHSAMYAFDRSRRDAVYDYVTWPAANMPVELMESRWYSSSEYPWTVSLGNAYQAPDIAKVKVTLTNVKTNKSWTFKQSTSSYEGNYFNVNNQGYGMNKCIIFRPKTSDVSYRSGDTFNVKITGLKDYAGNDTSLKYTVRFFSLNENKYSDREIVRLAGGNRYETGYRVADELKSVLDVNQFDAVVVTTGEGFADALAGSYLASVKNAPILLVKDKEKYIDQLHEYIKQNVKENGMIYILGGEDVVPKSVEDIEGFEKKRLAGGDRYETNIKILEEAGITGNEIIVATGKDYADSLSASAAKLPILLVNPKKGLSDNQKAITENAEKIYIVGGEAAVNKSIEAELAELSKVDRVAGDSRYKTSIAIANKFFDNQTVEKTIVAYAKDYPDGLCGGVLAAAMDIPLILTTEKNAGIAASYVAEKDIETGVALGGNAALTDAAVAAVFKLKSTTQIIKK